ncbi:MAG: hypothetical protein IMZ66_11430, partial [Planctomycetes bacterium]|nr:hypothetical protein [Planctomycetota bacterium]
VKPFERAVKGWVPRGWDDGAGYRKSGQRLLEGYDTSSNHLAQDLANLPLNVWLTTADPALARAVMDLEDYKLACFGPISVIEYAAGVMNARPDLFRKYTASAFTPLSLNPCTSGMVEQNGTSIPAYSDDLAWQYRSATAGCFLAGTMSEDAVLSGAAQAYASALAMEMYFDRGPYPYGMYLFDIQGPVRFVRGGGRLDAYASDSKKIFGARGIQFAWVGAGVLPHLAKHPDLWERLYREKHASEPLVRIVDVPPKTDGRKDRIYAKSQPLADGKTVVTLLADPKNLHVFLESAEAELAVEIRPAGPVTGDVPAGRFTATKDGRITATDARGGPLLYRAAFVAGDPWAAELRVPFGVVRGQAHFINGLDHGRYEVRVGGGPAQTVYLLSEPSRIIDRLEALALGTIATWHDVWKKTGIIPSGYHPVEDRRVMSWEISDAGNYAHLIHAIALWMIYQQGQSEWEIIRRDFPKQPLRAPPLPDSVLRAQGLE